MCCDRKSFYVTAKNLAKEKFLVATEFLGRDREGCKKWKKWGKVGHDLKFWVATSNFRSRPSSIVVGRLVCRNINFACRDIG